MLWIKRGEEEIGFSDCIYGPENLCTGIVLRHSLHFYAILQELQIRIPVYGPRTLRYTYQSLGVPDREGGVSQSQDCWQ